MIIAKALAAAERREAQIAARTKPQPAPSKPTTSSAPAKTSRSARALGAARDLSSSTRSRTASLSAKLSRELWSALLHRPPSLRHRVLFFRETGRMLDKGVPIDEALAATRRVLRAGPLAKALAQMEAQVRQGQGLAAAMESQPRIFEPVEVALCETAERTGQLGELFSRMRERLEVLREVTDKVKMSLLYPSLLLLMACVTLPLPLAFSDGLWTFAWAAGGNLALLGLGVLIFGVAFPRILQHPPWRATLLSWTAKIPVLSILMRRRRFALIFSALAAGLECGVKLNVVIPLATRASGEPAVIQAGERLTRRLSDGESLSEAAAELPGISEETLGLLATGERTGDLAETATLQAKEANKRFRDGVQVAGLVFRFAASLLISAIVAASIITHFQKVLGDPMAMMPKEQRRELKMELERAMPKLIKPGQP